MKKLSVSILLAVFAMSSQAMAGGRFLARQLGETNKVPVPYCAKMAGKDVQTQASETVRHDTVVNKDSRKGR